MQKYKEIKLVRTSAPINVSADQLWGIVGLKFQHIGVWNRAIDDSTGSGESEHIGAPCGERSCDVAVSGYDTIEEKLTLYSDESREFAYKVLRGLPGFVLFAGNHWSVVAISPSQCSLKMEITMHVTRFTGTILGPMLKWSFIKSIKSAFEDLAVYAESGKVSGAKLARMAQLEKKKRAA
ncbi:MAG: SRPBCC family protein [Nannocystaceae bacterium]|nr:SRPBCC family protein [Nannocystaceae bacterium]